MPVAVRAAADENIISYEFSLRYYPLVIQPQANAFDLAGTVNCGLSVVTNAKEPGLCESGRLRRDAGRRRGRSVESQVYGRRQVGFGVAAVMNE